MLERTRPAARPARDDHPSSSEPEVTTARGRAGRLRRLWHRLATVTVALLLLATIVSYLGDRWWAFELASNLHPQYAYALAALVGLCALAGRRLVAAAALVGLVANVVPLVPLHLASPTATSATEDVLRVMFLNVKIREADPAALAAYLRTADEDLVFLVAATDAWSEALRTADVPYLVLVSRPPQEDLEIVVLARRPELATRIHRWGTTSRSKAVEVRAELAGEPVRILVSHPVSPMGPERAALRRRQLDRLAGWAQEEPTPFVILGDLNATPWSASFRRMVEDGGMVDSQRGHGLAPTWPVALGPFGIPIDHALHAPELVTVERRRGSGFGSPHRSLHVAFSRLDPRTAPGPG